MSTGNTANTDTIVILSPDSTGNMGPMIIRFNLIRSIDKVPSIYIIDIPIPIIIDPRLSE